MKLRKAAKRIRKATGVNPIAAIAKIKGVDETLDNGCPHCAMAEFARVWIARHGANGPAVLSMLNGLTLVITEILEETVPTEGQQTAIDQIIAELEKCRPDSLGNLPSVQ